MFESSSAQKSSQLRSTSPGRALRTSASPEPKISRRFWIAALILRFTKFLWTALPAVLPTTRPNLNGSWLLRLFKYTTMWSVTALRPSFIVLRKSSADRSLFSRASKAWLSWKLATALTATGTKDCTSGSGLHTNTETMSLWTAPVVWLESALSHLLLQKIWWVLVRKNQ